MCVLACLLSVARRLDIYSIISLGGSGSSGISGPRGLYAALDVHGYAQARTSIYIYIYCMQAYADAILHSLAKSFVQIRK